ncbi:MAG: hypothetical protein CFE44_06315 [Burkholderiales bacterium PBB4]|nr:MAG: hypothetical protein CFE44_06315 [Burkholderiales bacterium PBB4]
MDMQLVAWLAAALVFTSFFMKTIVPLRTVAIVSNLVFIGYALLGLHHGIFDKVLPILVLHLALLPLNIIRLNEVRSTIRSIRAMQTQSKPHDFLIPYMTRSTVDAGTVLFKRGDHADTVFLLVRGTIYLPDINKRVVAGDMLGEVAIFSDHAVRSTTAVCEDKCELLRMKGEKVLELFYQNKTFAFQIARALSRYVVENTGMVADSRAEFLNSRHAAWV